MSFLSHIYRRFRAHAIDTRGTMLMYVLIFGSVAFTIIVTGVASYGLFEHRASQRLHRREMAFHIAEAGINYYRWHLAHNPTDYQDGTGQPGPYVHTYSDKDGNVIGSFSLEIDPPLAGSSVATIRSTGWTVWEPRTQRTLQVRVGFPALTDYTFLSNGNMNFSATSNVSGKIHSNGGIRFDGTTNSWVESAQSTYQYQPGQWRNGVWGSGGPSSFFRYPVPAIDFYAVSADLSALRTEAMNSGVHITSSGQEGWHIVFNSSTFDLYRVTSRDCYYGQGRWRWRRWVGWYWSGNTYCYDIGNETFVSTQSIPANGAIFVEDELWVEGTVGGRVSLGVGEFPVQQPYHRIYVTGNLVYNQRGGTDVTGLMAQGDVLIPYEVPDVMSIDGALLSQFGSVHRPYYYNNVKTSLSIFGAQIYYTPGGMKWVNGWGNVISGFTDTYYTYDGNLRYYPPPGFPVGNTYNLISWEEL